MHAFVRLFGVDARLARELDLDALKHWELRLRVELGNELGVKVHVRRQGRNRDKRGVADAEQRCDPVLGRADLVAVFGVKTGKMAGVVRETSMGWDQSSRFVKEARVNKGGFFEDNQVAACAFCRAHLVDFCAGLVFVEGLGRGMRYILWAGCITSKCYVCLF